MALFVDGPVSTIDDLTIRTRVCWTWRETCGIDATTKLRLAHEEIETDLQLWLDRPRPTLEMIWAPLCRIGQIVVTPPLKQWETMQALALFYRDAYFSQLVDRYQAKWDEYSSLTRGAYERFVASGMGMVHDPVRRAAPPLLGTVAGTAEAADILCQRRVGERRRSGRRGLGRVFDRCGRRQSDDGLSRGRGPPTRSASMSMPATR